MKKTSAFIGGIAVLGVIALAVMLKYTKAAGFSNKIDSDAVTVTVGDAKQGIASVKLIDKQAITLKVGDICHYIEDEKLSIPYRWVYSISNENVMGVFRDGYEYDDSRSKPGDGGDAGWRTVCFQAISPGECVITVRYEDVRDADLYDEERIYAVTVIAGNNQTGVGQPTGNVSTSDNAFVGTWYRRVAGLRGYTTYCWSFGADGRFARYVAGFEPPHDIIPSSISEYFMQGRFRENGNTIDCYDIQVDSYHKFSNEWKYFSNSEPAMLAGKLLETPLQDSENADEFSLECDFKSSKILRLVIDRGSFPDQYDMDFEYVSDAP